MDSGDSSSEEKYELETETLDKLFDDVLYVIFSFLPNDDLFKFGWTNRRFRKISSYNNIWFERMETIPRFTKMIQVDIQDREKELEAGEVREIAFLKLKEEREYVFEDRETVLDLKDFDRKVKRFNRFFQYYGYPYIYGGSLVCFFLNMALGFTLLLLNYAIPYPIASVLCLFLFVFTTTLCYCLGCSIYTTHCVSKDYFSFVGKIKYRWYTNLNWEKRSTINKKYKLRYSVKDEYEQLYIDHVFAIIMSIFCLGYVIIFSVFMFKYIGAVSSLFVICHLFGFCGCFAFLFCHIIGVAGYIDKINVKNQPFDKESACRTMSYIILTLSFFVSAIVLFLTLYTIQYFVISVFLNVIHYTGIPSYLRFLIIFAFTPAWCMICLMCCWWCFYSPSVCGFFYFALDQERIQICDGKYETIIYICVYTGLGMLAIGSGFVVLICPCVCCSVFTYCILFILGFGSSWPISLTILPMILFALIWIIAGVGALVFVGYYNYDSLKTDNRGGLKNLYKWDMEI